MKEEITLEINGETLEAQLEDNRATQELVRRLKELPIEIEMEDYGNMEKVGSLGKKLPSENRPLNVKPLDLTLYQSHYLSLYYGNNSWSLTPIGRITNVTEDELRKIIGSGDIEVIIKLKQ